MGRRRRETQRDREEKLGQGEKKVALSFGSGLLD